MTSTGGAHQRRGDGVVKGVGRMGRTMCRLGGLILVTLGATVMVLPETMAQPAGEEAAVVATEMGSSTAPVTLDGKMNIT